jgi:capsular polysaccharide biosynthesis protein
MSTGYRAFADQVARLAIGFRRDHRPEQLAGIRAIIDGLDPAVDEPNPRRRIVYSGWVSDPYRLVAARLREANPAYDIEVGHPVRRELGLRGRLRRFGFRVVATGPVDAPELVFFVTNSGTDAALLPSNDMARRQLARTGDHAPVRDDVLGYVDSIQESTLPSDAAPGHWLERLVQEHPALLWDFMESDASEGLRQRMVDALAEYLTNDRWADRYRLSATGLTSAFESDLAVLEVDRTEAGGSGGGPLNALELVVRGDRATWTPVERTLPVPDPGWLVVDDATLQDGGTVTTGDRLIRYEASADPALDFVAGQWQTTFGSARHPEGALLRRPDDTTEPIDEGILLAGRSDANWFHWMVEYLPRVVGIPQTIAGDVPLILTRRVPDTGLQALRELSARPTVFVDPAIGQPVRRLHVAAPPVQVLDTTKIPWPEGLSINRAPLDELRQRWGVNTPREGMGRRVFVTRRSRHRGISNEGKLVRVAERHGLEIVDPSGLDLAGQRELFSSTEVLVGASGAVMANYLFMRPGSHILALTSQQLADFVLPAALAAVVGCSFEYLLGDSATKLADVADRNHWIHADFRVDASAFDRALRDLP